MASKCSRCNVVFVDDEDFNTHPCVTDAMNDKVGRLKRMLAANACTQEYYDEQMATVKEKDNE